jgi:exodeoxyribonuclease VII large subunit
VDFSISDFVADRRAATPSAAAEIVVPDRKELSGVLIYFQEKMIHNILQLIKNYQNQLQNLKKSYAFRRPEDLIFQKMQRLDEISRLLVSEISHMLTLQQQNLTSRQQQLHNLNPIEILRRGYSICYKDGQVIKDVRQLQMLDLVQIKLSKGQFLSQVQMLGEGS